MDLPSRDTPESQIGLKLVMITTYRQAVDSRLDLEKVETMSMNLNQKRPSQNKRFFYWWFGKLTHACNTSHHSANRI